MKRIATLLLTLQLGLLAASAQYPVEPFIVWPLAYQGTVTSNGVPLDLPPSRPMDIILRLYDALSGGTQIGATITNSVEVTNGQFTVLLDGWTKTDLAAPALWLEVTLGSGSIGDPLVTLSPRQRMTDLPRAAVAETALTIPASALSVTNIGTNGVDGAILAPGSVQGDKIAAGQVVKSLNGLTDGVTLTASEGLALSTAGNTITLGLLPPWCPPWCLIGNAGTLAPPPQYCASSMSSYNFMGTTDLQPLELRVNKWRALRLEPTTATTAPNVIGGYCANFVAAGAYSATIGGGGSDSNPNQVWENYGTIGGGSSNYVSAGANWATIGGGFVNVASGIYATIGGGSGNVTSGGAPTIAGGHLNAAGDHAAVGGGFQNTASGTLSTIAGGGAHYATGGNSTIGGGEGNKAFAFGSTVAGGYGHYATGIGSIVGGGAFNNANSLLSTISGGGTNYAGADYATIGGGSGNSIQTDSTAATIGGGAGNLVATNAPYASIGGGESNTATTALQASTASYGQQAHASGQFANPGDAQGSLYVSRNITTNDTWTELFLDGLTERMVVPVNGTWTFQTLVVARDNHAWDYSSAGWRIEGVVEAYSNSAGDHRIQVLCQTITPLCSDQPGWAVTAVIWGGVGLNPHGLSIQVKGNSLPTYPVRWVATTRTSEVTNP